MVVQEESRIPCRASRISSLTLESTGFGSRLKSWVQILLSPLRDEALGKLLSPLGLTFTYEILTGLIGLFEGHT